MLDQYIGLNTKRGQWLMYTYISIHITIIGSYAQNVWYLGIYLHPDFDVSVLVSMYVYVM